MDTTAKRLYAHAALAYGALNCGAVVVVAVFGPDPEGASRVLLLPQFVLAALLAFWVHHGTRWLARFLTVVCGVRALHHLFGFVMPTPLLWHTPWFENFPLADGSGHPSYLFTAVMLGTAAAFLARAAWHRRTAPVQPEC